MKTKLLASALLLAGLLASALTATAQIRYVNARQNNQNAESLVMGITAYSAGTFTHSGCTWTSPTAPTFLNANSAMTGGVYDGFIFAGPVALLCSSNATNASNAGARGVIRGKNTNGGTASTIGITCSTSNALTVVIWGPTLNSYGVSGATHFTWTCTAGNGYSRTGTTEDTFTIPQYYTTGGGGVVSIIFTPTDDNEVGSVMANFYN